MTISLRTLVLALPLSAATARTLDRPARPLAADVLITVARGHLSMADSIAPGWRRIRVQEDGAGHIVVAFRLVKGDGPDALRRFVAALDTASATPAGALAMGGPEIGDTGEVILDLMPGRYVFGCVSKGKDGHRHAASGEAKLVIVGGRSPIARAPAVSDTVRMTEFAYVTAERWSPGPRLLRVANIGRQDHQLRINRLRDGATVSQWLKAESPGAYARPVVGLARTGPGAVAYLPIDLPAGDYVMYCLVTDPASKQMHVMRGMVKALRVE